MNSDLNERLKQYQGIMLQKKNKKKNSFYSIKDE